MRALTLMLIAAFAAGMASRTYRRSDGWPPHDSQRGWSDVTGAGRSRRSVWFLAAVWLVAVLLGVANLACAAEPAPATTYTLEVWASPRGFSMARSVGPLTAEDCSKALAQLKTDESPAPPNMRALIAQCVPKPTMVAQLAGWNCTAVGSKAIARRPAAKMWVYSCFAQ